MLKQIILVGLGGGLGSILRYLVSFFTAKYYAGSFPLATFGINILGCFLIGLFAGYLDSHFPFNTNLRLLLMAGFCGGYTTFSAFAMENFSLLEYGHLFTMIAYIVLSVLIGIAAVWTGSLLGSSL